MRYLIVMMVLWLCGCAMFRKTSRESVLNSRHSAGKLESGRMVLKSTDKETKIFTYWNDSGFYQVQHVKEQVDQSRLYHMKTEQKDQEKQTVVTKKTEPLSIWVYVVILVVVVFWIFIRYRRTILKC